ncbi:hypothetical protein EDD15DRAFT_2436520 [Pisolithus albus]|nr:hypothetical protein EDD15DRAFT_2436520 [Pisolithus albus]
MPVLRFPPSPSTGLNNGFKYREHKAVEYITARLVTAPEPGLLSLHIMFRGRSDTKRSHQACLVCASSLRNVSLWRNRISVIGAVALALNLAIGLKVSIDTVYSQIVDSQHLNLTMLGQTAEQIIGDANMTNLG